MNYKGRKQKLKKIISEELNKEEPKLENILKAVTEFEKNNLTTIKKLKRKKKITLNKINGAIRQTIDAHPVITKELIGSLSKRIYGSLLELEEEEKRKISIRDMLIGGIIVLIFLLFF